MPFLLAIEDRKISQKTGFVNLFLTRWGLYFISLRIKVTSQRKISSDDISLGLNDVPELNYEQNDQQK